MGLEARVSYLEGQVEGHSENLSGVRDSVTSLEARLDRRFDGVDRRFEALEARMTGLDQKIDRRLDSVDDRMSRQFLWMIGIQVTTLLTVIGAVLTAVLTR